LIRLICVLTLIIGCSNFGRPATEGAPRRSDGSSEEIESADSVETKAAIADLLRMSDFLASQTGLRFEAQISYDAIQASEQRIEFGSHRQIALRRPDGARFVVSHWNGTRELVTFDGERLSAASPEAGVYASMPFSGSVADALDHLVTEYDLATPLSDLLRPDFANEVESRMQSARRVGTATIDGERCDHLAFRGERVDFQIYIRQGEEPVPVRFLIDYHEEPGRPQFRTTLSSCKLSPDLPDALFQLRPPPGAQRVEFDELLELLHGPLNRPEEES